MHPPAAERVVSGWRVGVTSIAALLAISISASGADDVVASAEPARIVDGLHAALLEVAKRSESLGFESRFAILEPAVGESHDFPTIARLVGGRFWSSLSDGQRSRFVDAFRRASIATYATRFASAEDLAFDPAVFREVSAGRAYVRSHLLRADGSAIVFDYILQESEGKWRIVTILVDGVSDLALQRAELTRLYEEDGYQAIIDHLEARSAGS